MGKNHQKTLSKSVRCLPRKIVFEKADFSSLFPQRAHDETGARRVSLQNVKGKQLGTVTKIDSKKARIKAA